MPSDKTVGGGDNAFNIFFNETGAEKHVPALSSSIWSPLSSTRAGPAPTASCSTLNNSSLNPSAAVL
ncbi:hypothetical protein RHMOL_Rhmol05G0266700 [Rhododendron molle]|uniref:Uncharacterized protein n=1 Tax=Rhododendron molle TaxID=49168 RepID=A0ACC0NVH9_RHOML|nr:hypothetical protein RHMOL_Rhmol05G0266700 [Rhododendron molle]